MNAEQELSAYEVVNQYAEQDLVRILFEYGEEKICEKIAAFICENRKEKTH